MLRTWMTFLALALPLGGGCSLARRPAAVPVQAEIDYESSGLSSPHAIRELFATCAPPAGWVPKPMELSRRHASQVWLSPTGKTAYGVIRFNLPLPVPADWVVEPFLDEMKKNEGSATLMGAVLEDKARGGVRFMAQSHRYRLRIFLTTWGFKGWAIYAGTLVNEPENRAELKLAELAREHTVPAIPAGE